MSATGRLVLRAAIGCAVLGVATLVAGPRLYPFQAFYVRSGSMSPAIPVGSLVVATRASAGDLRPGDVIVFRRPDRPQMVVHRIVTVEESGADPVFVTQGDANGSPDGWQIPASGDGWQARYSISRAGFVLGWLDAASSRRGWLALLAIVAAVSALLVIWRSEDQ